MRDLRQDLEDYHRYMAERSLKVIDLTVNSLPHAIDRAIKAEAEVERLRSLVNLCDICINRSEIPVCMPDDIEFGCGLGNDNVVKCCSFYRKG
jgi:hypothetical protein